MTDPAITEAAAQALRSVAAPRGIYQLQTGAVVVYVDEASAAVLAVVTPMIRAAALEEAAEVVENSPYFDTREKIAAAIRALKEQP